MSELDDYYVYKTERGLADRISKLAYEVDEKAYKERLEYENKIIIQMGYPGYFLVVQDFINWAKSQGILVGPGRGSGAGALACFATGITNVDPIPFGLIFERFLNPARVSMPDLDIDFPKGRREEVIQYVRDKYGADKVAQIGTFGTLKAKASIKAACRTLGLPIPMGEELTKMWPKPEHGKEVSFQNALTTVPDLNRTYRSAGERGEILRWAEKIENRISSFGIHASGVVIANEPLHETVPLALGKRGEIVTQWDMNRVEDVGLIKFDFLGLKNLDVVQLAVDLIKKQKKIEIDIENIPLDDEKVYSNLRKGDNIGVFQLESSSGMKDLLVKIKPSCLEDLTALVAIYRPGPLGSDKLEDYLSWRAGTSEPVYYHPDLEPILKSTGGWIIYQEQVLRIARDLAGYDLAQADLLRRAVGKKKASEMLKHRAGFLKGIKANGYTENLGITLWNAIEIFSSYGFNKTVDKDTLVATVNGDKRIEDCSELDTVFTVANSGEIVQSQVVALHDHGNVPLWEVEFDDGSIERCTLDHKWLTIFGQQPLWRILQEDIQTFGNNSQESGNKFAEVGKKVYPSQDNTLWNNKNTNNQSFEGPSKAVPGMSKAKEVDSSKDEGQVKQVFPYEKDSIRNSKENLSKTRDTITKSEGSKEVERFTPRIVRFDKRKSTLISKALQDGDLVTTYSPEAGVCSLSPTEVWYRKEASRFRKSLNANSNRSGWTLAFSTGEWRREPKESSRPGSNVRTRDYSSKLEADSSFNGELSLLWETYKNKLGTPFQFNRKQTISSNLTGRKVIRISYKGICQGYDLEVDHPAHNFLLSSGLCCSNSHAVAYATISYWCAYLKTYHPVEFMTAALTMDSGNMDQMIIYLQECKRIGIQVLPPDINESDLNFTPVANTVRFGFTAIKNLREGPGNHIIEKRNEEI